MCAAVSAWSKRIDTKVSILLGLHLPLLDSLAQTRDQRPLRKGERQRIFSSVEAHSVRPCLNLSAVSNNLLLHISAALRRRGMTVPRNSFTRYYRQFLRISFINQPYRRVRRPRRTVANDLHTFNRRGGHWPPTQRKTTMSILHSPFSILNFAQKRTRNSRFGFFYLTPAQTLRYRADNICRVPRSAAHGCRAR